MIYEHPPLDGLTRYLRRRMPDVDELTVTDVMRSWPGMSRETWFVSSTATRAGQLVEQRHVLRLDPPGGGFGLTSLSFEASVYKMLDGTDIPMQPMLWHEPAGNDWLDGREFFVRVGSTATSLRRTSMIPIPSTTRFAKPLSKNLSSGWRKSMPWIGRRSVSVSSPITFPAVSKTRPRWNWTGAWSTS